MNHRVDSGIVIGIVTGRISDWVGRFFRSATVTEDGDNDRDNYEWNDDKGNQSEQ